ncbi:LuxR C-terminal-related transcriptional regulator [Streptomyces sp. NPDC096153]|uniref:response regulator transcription factor n=1 Tax=Streptomyces sp. NPDC096153 TaxID=3155548 RepID=UPI00332C3926
MNSFVQTRTRVGLALLNHAKQERLPLTHQQVHQLSRIATNAALNVPTVPVPADEVLLTSREMDVLYGLVRGLSAQQTANELFLSINTVKTHRRKLFKHLGVENAVEAAVKAVALQLVRPEIAREAAGV